MPPLPSWTNAERWSSSAPSDVVSVPAIVAVVPLGSSRTSAIERGASVVAGVGGGGAAGLGGAVGLAVGLGVGLRVGVGAAPGPGVGGAARSCGDGTA